MKKILVSILLLLQIAAFGQESKWHDRLSVKSAYAFSVTQQGRSPFSSTRDARRGISSILLNVQYSYPVSTKISVTGGIQACEKGFVREETVISKNAYYISTTYEYGLNYAELPVGISYQYKKTAFLFGLVTSYLYEGSYRLKQHEIEYDNSGKEIYNGTSYYATPTLDGMYSQWDFGVLGGISRTVYKGINIELTAQKQMINASRKFTNNEDIRYSLTLALGVRYTFL